MKPRLGTKLHAVVDALGLPVRFEVVDIAIKSLH
jgi:hypothetical protein